MALFPLINPSFNLPLFLQCFWHFSASHSLLANFPNYVVFYGFVQAVLYQFVYRPNDLRYQKTNGLSFVHENAKFGQSHDG